MNSQCIFIWFIPSDSSHIKITYYVQYIFYSKKEIMIIKSPGSINCSICTEPAQSGAFSAFNSGHPRGDKTKAQNVRGGCLLGTLSSFVRCQCLVLQLSNQYSYQFVNNISILSIQSFTDGYACAWYIEHSHKIYYFLLFSKLSSHACRNQLQNVSTE